MRIDCPIVVRQTYGKLLETPQQEAVKKALEHPGAEDSQVWELWKQWLVHFSFRGLRPKVEPPVDVFKLCQWVAFALRYLHPLLTDKDRPQSGEAAMNVINNYPRVVATLLFGSEEECLAILPVAFDPAMLHKDTQLNTDQQGILQAVQERSSDEKTARNWSDALRDRLKSRVVKYFHSEEEQALRALSSALLKGNAERSAAHPSVGYNAQFEHYLRLAEERKDRAVYGQALGYFNEFSGRMALAERYVKQIKWPTVLLFLVMLSIGVLPIEAAVKGVLITFLVFNVITLFYGRVFNYLAETFTSAQANLATLQTLLGDTEIT